MRLDLLQNTRSRQVRRVCSKSMIKFIKDNYEIISLAVAVVGFFTVRNVSKKKHVQIQKAKSGSNSSISQTINNKDAE